MTRKCTLCPHWGGKALGRCKLGKINPRTVKGGLEAVRLCEVSYICSYAKHYEAIMKKLNESLCSIGEQR